MNNKEEIRELPWYIGDPEPTPQITEKIVTRFPFYAINRPEISSYYETFYKCRSIVKDYFTERAKQAKSSKMQQIAEEAWKLVSQFVGLFEMGKNQDLSRWNVLNDKWNTVIQKFKIYISSGEQQEKPAETERNATTEKIINIENFRGILADDIQAEIVQTGDHSSIHKQTIAGEKKKGIIRKILKIIVKVISAIVIGIIVAIVIDILGDFGWLQSIKEFIYNELPK